MSNFRDEAEQQLKKVNFDRAQVLALLYIGEQLEKLVKLQEQENTCGKEETIISERLALLIGAAKKP